MWLRADGHHEPRIEPEDADMEAHYTRLFTDDDGESCFEDMTAELRQAMSVEGIEAVPSPPGRSRATTRTHSTAC